MISKELLSAVLKEKRVILDYEISISKNEIHYGHIDIEEDGFINIYELAHKCKEWALEHDCELLSCIRSKDRAICDIYSDKYDCKFTHYGETEPEAIFRACQWILNKDSK